MDFSFIKNIVEKIKCKMFANNFNKQNSPTIKGDRNIFSLVDKRINNYSSGLTYSEAKDLIQLVVKQEISQYTEVAKVEYEKRAKEFESALINKIKNLTKEELTSLREPDVQIALYDATKIAGRKEDKELHNLLAELVINRVKSNKTGEFKNIVYNEAILTINKLTINQLKILTLIYLLRYAVYSKVTSWKLFNEHLNTYIKPLLDFNNTEAEFQHIEYTGCGSIKILLKPDLVDIYRTNYSFLFFNPIEKIQIDNLGLSNEAKAEIVGLSAGKDSYYFKFQNKRKFEIYLQEKEVDDKTINTLLAMYERHIKSNNEVRSKISNETDIGKVLLNLWDESTLQNVFLTSVGMVVSSSYFEQLFANEKINIDMWLN